MSLRDALTSLAGPEAVRDPDPVGDRVGAIVPTLVVEPHSAEQVAAVLGWASRERQTVVIRGAGTRMGWGRPPGDVDLLLSLRGLNRVLAHEHGDLTVTAEAGVTLGDLNVQLAQQGQYLPLDPPGADAMTIGGLLATNESGPLRHRYGTPRDLVIGIQIATPSGVLARAGGRVVKNVAGYDLSKLMTGSFGSLAAIVTATFKLSPLPLQSATVEVRVADDGALARLVREVMGSQLDLAACEIVVDLASDEAEANSLRLLARCTSRSGSIDPQIADALRITNATGRTATAVTGEDERALWASLSSGPAPARPLNGAPRSAIIRASWLPADLERALTELRRCASGLQVHLTGRAALGAGHIALSGPVVAQAQAIENLRTSSAFGNVVLVSGPSDVKALVDVWGPPGSAHAVLVALKHTFDPAGILNAGRGPV